jgi:hypothetical protein
MTATDIVSILTVLTCVGAFSLLLLLLCARVLALRQAKRRRSDATRARSPTLATSFIEMPKHLKTRQEMVDWMQHDLPRQTAGLILSDRE